MRSRYPPSHSHSPATALGRSLKGAFVMLSGTTFAAIVAAIAWNLFAMSGLPSIGATIVTVGMVISVVMLGIVAVAYALVGW